MDPVSIVSQAFDCFRAGNIDGITELCSDDTEWQVVGTSLPWSGLHKVVITAANVHAYAGNLASCLQGKAAVKDGYFGRVFKHVKGTGFDTPTIVAGGKDGSWVFAPQTTYTCVPLDQDRQPVQSLEKAVPMCMAMVVEHGKITRYWNYSDSSLLMEMMTKAGSL